MTSLTAIVRATRSSAAALQQIQQANRRLDDLAAEARRGFDRQDGMASVTLELRAARRRYAKAQAILAANPLPGDR